MSFLGEANLLLSCHESVLHYFVIYCTCNLLIGCENLSRWYGIQKGILESFLRIVHSMHKSFAILTVSPWSITSNTHDCAKPYDTHCILDLHLWYSLNFLRVPSSHLARSLAIKNRSNQQKLTWRVDRIGSTSSQATKTLMGFALPGV